MDVAFLIDSSGSIGEVNFEKQKDFVNVLAQKIGISPKQGRSAIVVYHGTASVRARFGDFKNTGDFQRAVRNLQYTRGRSRIDKALNVAARDVFPDARNGVEKIAIVLTDGHQTHDIGAQSLKEASEPLRRAGVRVIVIGVGGDVSRSELRLMVESDEDVVIVNDFDDLKMKADFIFGQLPGKSKM